MKKIKKTLLLVITLAFVFTLVSCKDNPDKHDIDPIIINPSEKTLEVLGKVDYPNKNYEQIDATLIEGLSNVLFDFSKKFTDKIFDNENEFYSPLSLYMACGMLYEGVSDQSMKEELKSLLVYEPNELSNKMKSVFEADYYVNDNGRTYLSNSMWFKNGLNVKKEYINTLKDLYYAESYQVDFSSYDVKKTIVDWINHYTEDLLKLTPENYNIDNSLAVLLLNTIYFNNRWAEEFKEESLVKKTFNLSSNSKVDTEFMTHTIESSYYIGNDYTVVKDYFCNGNVITYVMPNNYDLTSLNQYQYSELVSNLKYNDGIVLTVPTFECFKEYNLKETFQALGVNGIFDSSKNGLRNITECLYVDYIKQNTGIKLTRDGVEAAAVTSIGNKCTSAGPEPEPVKIVLDKPFMYYITDAYGLPLFVGYCQNPTINK